jgi:hypothetical protein
MLTNLALEGWYLLYPHYMYTAEGSLSGATAPLPEWEHYGSYDSASMCEAAKQAATAEAAKIYEIREIEKGT